MRRNAVFKLSFAHPRISAQHELPLAMAIHAASGKKTLLPWGIFLDRQRKFFAQPYNVQDADLANISPAIALQLK
jgi:hypothetical protein